MPESNVHAPIRVLIVDDEEDDFILTSEQIKDIKSRSFDMEWCSNYKSAVERIGKGEHDIYFIDYRLGVKTGIDLLKEPVVQQCQNPIILLTGQGNPAIDLEAMRLGAVDYLIKSELNTEKLERCIRYSLERAATLKASRASEKRYRNIFERTRDVIFIADERLALTNINDAAIEVLGYGRDYLLMRSLYDLITEETDRDLLAARLNTSGKVDDFQVEIVNGNQMRKVVLISASREMDMQGQPYYQGVIHDITLLKRAEEITLQAEKLESKAMVIRTLAHEIRNPLNNINVSIEQIKAMVSADDVELLNIVQRGVRRIDDLINQLMDSSRYFKMKFGVMPLQTVLDKAIEEATDRIALKKISLQLDYAPQPATVLVDQDKIKIAFLNIILNAIEAMEEGKGILKLTVRSRPNVHEVVIADNGCGMSEEVSTRLFEPYFTAKPNGVGLGLASAFAIIQSHKSTIEVESKLSVGTAFTISFPSL